MFSSILLPIDLSSETSWQKALPAALRILDEGGELHVVTVVPSFGYSMVSSYFDEEFEKNALHDAGEKLTAWVEEHAGGNAKATPHVLHGRVYDEIIRAAEKLNVDAVVMASHRPEASDYLIGPNAARVVRHARQSVFVIRD